MAEIAAAKQRRRGPGRPFELGRSGNPRGKLKGTPNRATMLLEAITTDDLQMITTKIVEKAKSGDLVAAKLLFDRLVPLPKSRAVPIELQAIGEWDGTDAVLLGHRAIMEAVRTGEISPAEALELITLIERHRATIKELRPTAMHREPTPNELAQRKRQDEEFAEVMKRLSPRL
jgi:hypothetical protein